MSDGSKRNRNRNRDLTPREVVEVAVCIGAVLLLIVIALISKFWGAVYLLLMLVLGARWFHSRPESEIEALASALKESDRKMERLPVVGPVLWLVFRIEKVLVPLLLLLLAYGLFSTLAQGPNGAV